MIRNCQNLNGELSVGVAKVTCSAIACMLHMQPSNLYTPCYQGPYSRLSGSVGEKVGVDSHVPE